MSLSFCIFHFFFFCALILFIVERGLVPGEYFFHYHVPVPPPKEFSVTKKQSGAETPKKNSKPQGCFLQTRFAYCFSDFSSLTYLLRVIFSSCGILLLCIVLITLDINSWPKPHN